MFYLLIPFLNILLDNINKQQHKRLIAILVFLYTFLSTIPKFNVVMNYVSWFSTLYLVAAYIRVYPPRKRNWGFLTIAFVEIAVLSILVCLKLGDMLNKQIAYRFVSDSNTFLAFAISVCSFMYFKGLKLKQSKLINVIGGSTFGVLCIHANSMPMINWLWKDCLDVSAKYNLSLIKLMSFSIITVFEIFVVCTLIDRIRVHTIEKFFIKWIDNSRHYLEAKKIFEIF